jgi:hypothetical protein
MASFSLILLLVLGLAGFALLIVGLVLVVWAVMQDRKSGR